MPLAYIYWVNEGNVPAHPIAPGGPPPQVWPGPGYPAHPIAPGGPPPGIWPSPGHPAHPIAPGGPPPGIWPSPGVPTHPIYIPVPPPPDSGLAPEHPIYIPVYPDNALPGPQPHPEHPIVLPSGKDFVAQIKKAIDFWTGNLPENPNPHPAPV